MSEAGHGRGPVRGILFTHAEMARGMLSALARISGVAEDAVVPLSNEGMAPQALADAVNELAGDEPAVVFTDLPSGSCAMAARLSCRGRGARAVVCGVNLPMLLDFVFHREMPLEQLVPRLVTKGRDAVQALGEPEATPGPTGPGSG